MKNTVWNMLMEWKNALLLAVCGVCFLSCGQTLPYQDSSLSPEERAEDLVHRLTLEDDAA